jgi:hypothetical protein
LPHITPDHEALPAGIAREITTTRSRLASLLDQVAETFDHTAQLAEQHARRLSNPQNDATTHTEWERAHQARQAAQRARAHAYRLRNTPQDPRSETDRPDRTR